MIKFAGETGATVRFRRLELDRSAAVDLEFEIDQIVPWAVIDWDEDEDWVICMDAECRLVAWCQGKWDGAYRIQPDTCYGAYLNWSTGYPLLIVDAIDGEAPAMSDEEIEAEAAHHWTRLLLRIARDEERSVPRSD